MEYQVTLKHLLKLTEHAEANRISIQGIRADLDCIREQLEEINSRLNDMGQEIESIRRKGVARGEK